MGRGLDWSLTVGAAALVVAAAGMLAWQHASDASALHVAGRVVDLDCGAVPTACRPIVEFRAPDGSPLRVRGREVQGATTYEVGDEWIAVLYHPDTGVATLGYEESPLSIVAVLLALVGSASLGFGWTGLSGLLRAERRSTWPRAMAASFGVVGCVTCYGLVGWRYIDGSTAIGMAFVTAASVAPALIRLGQRSHYDGFWSALPAYGLAIVALVAAVGLLVLPASLRGGLLASAPFACTVTLPLQVRLWPSMERWLAGRRERARFRARLRGALDAAAGAREIIVRVDSLDLAERTASVVRSAGGGAALPLNASLDAFVGSLVEDGCWYLLVDPVVEQRVRPASGGYREVAHESWIVTAQKAEALGADLERALRGDPGADAPALLFLVPLLVCFAVSALGSYVLTDRTPALSRGPIPAAGLVEGLDRPLSLSGRIAEVSEWPGLQAGDPCTVVVEPTGRSDQTCHVQVSCAGSEIYPGSGGYLRCLSSASGAIVGEDTSMTDGDPAMRIDTRSGRVVVRVSGGANGRSATVKLQPR